jgi:hypothetical protein
MRIDRLRPKPGEDLAMFLSGVVHDAMKDATEAGMPLREAVQLLRLITDEWDRRDPRPR